MKVPIMIKAFIWFLVNFVVWPNKSLLTDYVSTHNVLFAVTSWKLWCTWGSYAEREGYNLQSWESGHSISTKDFYNG